MEKNEFELLILAITGLKSDITNELKRLETKVDEGFAHTSSEFKRLETKVDEGFAHTTAEFKRLEFRVDTGFTEVRKDLSIIRSQTANVTERLVKLENTASL